MSASVKSPQIEDNANTVLDRARGLPNFRYILLKDDERLHISDNYSRTLSPRPSLCGSERETSHLGWCMNVPLDEIEKLPARPLDELMLYPLCLPVCQLCELVAKMRIKESLR